mgnify:FL=1
MLKILIVEDDMSISNELKNLLDNAGYNGVVLKDFENSLEEIKNENPDLKMEKQKKLNLKLTENWEREHI